MCNRICQAQVSEKTGNRKVWSCEKSALWENLRKVLAPRLRMCYSEYVKGKARDTWPTLNIVKPYARNGPPSLVLVVAAISFP